MPAEPTAAPIAAMHKDKVLKLAKGFRGRAKNCVRIARERVEKSLQYAFRDRKTKKRDMRALWITRISAGTRQYGVSAHTRSREGSTQERCGGCGDARRRAAQPRALGPPPPPLCRRA